MSNLLQIDGSYGEGGGQILRTSLTMSMLTGTPIQISNIRAKRSKPGLKAQHLACIHAAQTISNAEISGAKPNSQQIIFRPNSIKAGDYHFRIGTAGSTTLLMQTVAPALMTLNKKSTMIFEGGTHTQWAPTYDFIAQAYLPMLKRMGVAIEVNIERYGFYPQGGGQWSATIKPSSPIQALKVLERGELLSQKAVITCCKIPEHVPKREILTLLPHTQWSAKDFKRQWVNGLAGGNVISLRLFYENCSEVIDTLGRKGLASHIVANNAAKLLRQYLKTDAPIGEYLADQLLLPMAIAKGGVFRTTTPSQHTFSNRKIIEVFTGQYFKFEKVSNNMWEISL